MEILLIAGMFVFCLVIQGSVLALAGNGVQPDLLLIVVVSLALLSDSRRGAIIGFAAGLLQDIFFASPPGFFAVGKMLAGALAGSFSREIYRDLVLVPLIVLLFLTAFNDTVTFLMAKLLDLPQVQLYRFWQSVTLPRLLLHLPLMALVYMALFQAHKRGLLFPDYENED